MQGTFISAKKQPGISLKDERDVVKETEMEFRRRQSYKRIFPSIDYAYYKQFFVQERSSNALLDQRVMARRRVTTETTQMLKQKIMSSG